MLYVFSNAKQHKLLVVLSFRLPHCLLGKHIEYCFTVEISNSKTFADWSNNVMLLLFKGDGKLETASHVK